MSVHLKPEINLLAKIGTLCTILNPIFKQTIHSGSKLKHTGSKMRDRGSKMRDRGSKMRYMGSKMRDRGSKLCRACLVYKFNFIACILFLILINDADQNC